MSCKSTKCLVNSSAVISKNIKKMTLFIFICFHLTTDFGPMCLSLRSILIDTISSLVGWGVLSDWLGSEYTGRVCPSSVWLVSDSAGRKLQWLRLNHYELCFQVNFIYTYNSFVWPCVIVCYFSDQWRGICCSKLAGSCPGELWIFSETLCFTCDDASVWEWKPRIWIYWH